MNPARKTALIILGVIAILVLAFGPYAYTRLAYLWRSEPATPPAEVVAQPTGEPNRLSIPSLALEAPIVYPTEIGEDAYQVALREGVVHYPGTAEPGLPGNVYIFGHSSDFLWAPGGYKTVFAVLPEIAIGAEIQISNPTGEIFTYVVKETKVVNPKDLEVLDQGQGEFSRLTLQTSYPLGTALQRFLVIAELNP